MVTKLKLVNEAIQAVGLAPVTSIDSTHPSFRKALAKFDYVNAMVQSAGWWFNDYYTTLTPGTDGTIVVPQFATSIEVKGKPNFIIRGNRMYDHDTRSDQFSGPVEARVIKTLPIEEVPPSIRFYIGARTKLEHYVDEDGGDPKLTMYNQAAELAYARAHAEDLRHRQLSSQEGDTFASAKYPHIRRSGRGGFR